jgi:hypothetical protein
MMATHTYPYGLRCSVLIVSLLERKSAGAHRDINRKLDAGRWCHSWNLERMNLVGRSRDIRKGRLKNRSDVYYRLLEII